MHSSCFTLLRFLDMSTAYNLRSNTSCWYFQSSKEFPVAHLFILKYYRQTVKTELGFSVSHEKKCFASVAMSLGLHEDKQRRQGSFDSRRRNKTLNLSTVICNRRKGTSERYGKARLDRRKREKGMKVTVRP